MNIKLDSKLSGKLNLQIIRKGKIVKEYNDVPNLILNGALQGSYGMINDPSGPMLTFTTTAESYINKTGTWSQSGNTVTRASGTDTFPASPSQVGNLLQWETGEKVYITAWTSTTQFTVSGPARTITGKTLRCNLTAAASGEVTNGASSVQTSSTVGGAWVEDATKTFRTFTKTFNFPSATSAYTLGSLQCSGFSRIKLPSTFAIDIDDQIQGTYVVTQTFPNRDYTFDIGAESTAIPMKYTASTIVGNGTYFDITFSAATHFLAGDKLRLTGVVPKKFAIASASSTSTTLTINTASAHGISPGDSVTIENASLAGYNGTFTAATASGTVITITDAANPGAMGAVGTVRKATPGTYFAGDVTIASMQSTTVARVTSTVTGPAIEPLLVGGDPGCRFINHGPMNGYHNGQAMVSFVEANVKAIIPLTQTTLNSTTGGVSMGAATTTQTLAVANEFTAKWEWTANAGTTTSRLRVKQFYSYAGATTGPQFYQITLNTPFNKTDLDRLKVGFSFQHVPDLAAYP